MLQTPHLTNHSEKSSGVFKQKTERIDKNSNLLFLFGDNDKAKYRTDKNNPGGYTPNIDEFKALMDKEFTPIKTWVREGGFVVIPIEYTKAIERQVYLTFVDELELFFTKEREYKNTIRVKDYLDYLKGESIKLLKKTNMAGVVLPALTIVEEYSEIITEDPTSNGHSDSRANYGVGTIQKLYCQLEERVESVSSYEMVNMTLSVDLSSLNISKTLPMKLWSGKGGVYIVDNTDMKHIPYLTKHEYEESGLRVASAPLKYRLHEPQCSNIITKKHDRTKCNVDKVYRTCRRKFTFSSEPLIFANSTNLLGTILYISGHKTLTAAANYPAEMHILSYLPYGEYEINYTGSKHRTVFVVYNPSYGFLTGESEKGNILVTETSNFKVIADLQDDHYYKRNMLGNMGGSVYFITDHDSCIGIFVDHDKEDPLFPYCTKGILLLDNIYNYFSNSNSEHRVITHCKTRSINVKNAEVRQGGKDCHDQDYEIRVVNEGNLHYRGLKQTIFIVGEGSDGAKILRDERNKERIKNNTDVIFANVADIKQLKVSEEKEGGYSLNLLANSTQSTVSSVKIDSFENLEIWVKYHGVKWFVTVQNKSLFDTIKDVIHQMLSNRTDVDEEVVHNSKKKLKAAIRVSIQDPGFSAYEAAKNIANNNNLGIPISKIEVTKNYTLVSNEKVIIDSVYSEQTMIDFGDNNSNVANSNREGYNYRCNYYQNIIVEGGNRYIIKLPEYNHTLKRGILESPMFNLNLEIRGEAEYLFYKIVDLGEFGAIDVNDINMIKGKRRYFKRSDFNDCYNYLISDLTEDSLEIKNVTVLNDEGIKWSLSVGLVDYFRSSKHQFIALKINGKLYIINNRDLKLEHVESDPDSFKRYQPDERLQIYNNQPINNDDTIIINLRDKSILDFDMEVIGSLILSSRNNTIVQVENWSTYQPARKMMFVFYETIVKCMKFDCNQEDIVEEFEKEKAKLVNKKGAEMGIFFPEERRNEESTRRHKHHHKGHRNPPIQEVTSSAARSSSWINVFANTIVGAVRGASQFISSPFKPAIDMEHSQPSKAAATQGTDVNVTLFLLDVFIRKITGQKYISTADQNVPLLEAQGYTLNITEKFEKVVEQAGLKSGILMHRLNIDFVEIQKEVTGKIMSGKFNEISEVLSSYVKRACPGREAGKLSPKKFDKFMATFNNKLDVSLNQSIHQMLHDENNVLKMDNIKESQSLGLSGPRTRLDDVLIAGNARELVTGRR